MNFSIKNGNPKLNLNILASNEYVGDIERENRALKEGTRTLINDLPYSHYPKSMVIGVQYIQQRCQISHHVKMDYQILQAQQH